MTNEEIKGFKALRRIDNKIDIIKLSDADEYSFIFYKKDVEKIKNDLKDLNEKFFKISKNELLSTIHVIFKKKDNIALNIKTLQENPDDYNFMDYIFVVEDTYLYVPSDKIKKGEIRYMHTEIDKIKIKQNERN